MLTPVYSTASPGIRPALSDTEPGVRRAALMLVQLVGGLPGLYNLFEERGHGELIAAWCGGQARRITPHQLHDVIGREWLRHLAEFADLSLAQTLAGLSDFLPGYVAHELRSDDTV